ncbi:MAG TPA: hypothetical protein VGL78_12470 [Solirubrobacteraceae bacterium]|jgi:hypothetical protein
MAQFVAGVPLGVFITALAQTSDAGFNPVRGFALDILAGSDPSLRRE